MTHAQIHEMQVLTSEMHESDAACRLVETKAKVASEELSRLFTDGLGMAEDATALGEQLGKVANSGSGGFESMVEART